MSEYKLKFHELVSGNTYYCEGSEEQYTILAGHLVCATDKLCESISISQYDRFKLIEKPMVKKLYAYRASAASMVEFFATPNRTETRVPEYDITYGGEE